MESILLVIGVAIIAISIMKFIYWFKIKNLLGKKDKDYPFFLKISSEILFLCIPKKIPLEGEANELKRKFNVYTYYFRICLFLLMIVFLYDQLQVLLAMK